MRDRRAAAQIGRRYGAEREDSRFLGKKTKAPEGIDPKEVYQDEGWRGEMQRGPGKIVAALQSGDKIRGSKKPHASKRLNGRQRAVIPKSLRSPTAAAMKHTTTEPGNIPSRRLELQRQVAVV